MSIFVKTLMGKTINIFMQESSTVMDLMIAVENFEGIPPDHQRLIFAGRELEDDKTLNDYNIQKNSIVHLAIKVNYVLCVLF